jgi:hypothetical protein
MHAAKVIGRYERWGDRAVPFDLDARAAKHRRTAASAQAGHLGRGPEHAAGRMVSAVADDQAEFRKHVSADGQLRE